MSGVWLEEQAADLVRDLEARIVALAREHARRRISREFPVVVPDAAREPELCSVCGSRARRNAEIFARHFSHNPPRQKAMAAEYGISATGIGTVIQKRLSALRREGPKDSAEWDAWSERKAAELRIEDVRRFTEALWGNE